MLNQQPTPPQSEPESLDARSQRAPEFVPALTLEPAWKAGRKLAEARRQRGWSLDEVAERIRVRREFLQALEEMNVKVLPGKAYALAFLRSYARELGVEDKALVDQFQEECALTRDEPRSSVKPPVLRRRKHRPWSVAAGLVLLGVLFVGWRAWEMRPGRDVANDSPIAAPAVAVGATQIPQAASVDTRVVEIRALAEAWLEARGPDGTVFLSRTLRPGDVYRPDPSPGWTLHARDGGAFELYVNGVSAGPLGVAGMPVLGRPIDQIQPQAQAGAASSRS